MDKYQFLKEEERLDYTLQTLNEEILNYIEKRKEIATYILDYRKNFIEEHKDDEDALMEYDITCDKSEMLMIGDASGKPGQFSDSDKKTAENFGIDYLDVEDFCKTNFNN